jgi:membrane dipeptidase
MRFFGYFLVTVQLLLVLPPAIAKQTDEGQRVHATVLGVDAHNDTLQRVLLEGVDIGKHLSDGEIDIPRLREGGIHVPFFAMAVPEYYKGADAVRGTLDFRDAMQRVLDKYPDQIELATSANDIQRIVSEKKIGVVLTVEGGHQIADDLAVLRMYRKMGVLSMTLTHFRNNDWADSSTGKAEHNGLTDFGKEVVREMNRIGMIVDVSHVSDKTFYDVLAVSTKPVIASHSSCRVFSDIPRNMSDDMLKALAQNGGVVGVNLGASFLNQKEADRLKSAIALRNTLEPNLSGPDLDQFALKQRAASAYDHPRVGEATLEDAANCIDHIAKLAGVDHVGIGSDFDGIQTVSRGLEDISKVPALTSALFKRNYSEQDIQKIMGGNFLRVIRSVVGQ